MIMLLVNKTDISELSIHDANNIKFMPVPEEEMWKINMVKEITDIKFGEKVLEDFPHDDLEKILHFICTT